MRLIVNFTKNTEPVPVNNQNVINSYIHDCLGRNNKYHDISGDYNISLLLGGTTNENGFMDFKNGGRIIISTQDNEFLEKLLSAIMLNKNLSWGMIYKNVDFINEIFYSGINHFYTLSPILLKKITGDKKYTFHTKNDSDFDEVLTIRMKNKLQKISDKSNLKLNLSDFKITTTNSGKEKVKPVIVKNVLNKVSTCIVSITCKQNVAELIYHLGLGQSTNSGFGCVCKVENQQNYKLG